MLFKELNIAEKSIRPLQVVQFFRQSDIRELYFTFFLSFFVSYQMNQRIIDYSSWIRAAKLLRGPG